MPTNEQHPERRFIGADRAPLRVEARNYDDDDGPQVLYGLATTYYDGTEATEYELWPGVRERIMPGAFKRAIKERDDARALFNHNPDNVLGRVPAGTLRLRETKRGPEYEIELPDTQLGRDLPVQIERKDVTGSSFSFTALNDQWHTEDGDDIREISDVELFDVGPVTYPAYENTTAAMRSAGSLDDVRASHERWREAQAMETRAKALKQELDDIA